MWSTFLTTVNAVVPIILLIMLGYALKRIGLFNANFIKTGNKFVFRVCLPCMLFINVYDSMSSFSDIRWDVVLYAVVIICVIFGLGLLTAVLTTKDNRRRGVILQCAFRSNFAVIGLPLVERLGGDVALAGIISAFSIPVFNILAVVALTVFVGGEQSCEQLSLLTPAKKSGAKSVVLNVIKNPLIIGVAAGLVFVGIREIEAAACGVAGADVPFRFDRQLEFAYVAVKDIKLIASPLALIVLGAQFEFSAVKGMTKEITVATLMRIVVTPLVGIGAAILFSEFTDLLSFGPEVYPTLIALFGTPVAVSSAIMAAEMSNDEQLAAQLVVWTSLGSIITVFTTVFALTAFGLLA